MVDKTIVQEWLLKALEDYCFARDNLRDGSEFFAQICFHFHQSAEKCLKAYIIGKGLPLHKVHDLMHLLRAAASVDDSFNRLREDCVVLNSAYIESRYPVHWPTNYTREAAEQAELAAENISRFVRDKLKCPE